MRIHFSSHLLKGYAFAILFSTFLIFCKPNLSFAATPVTEDPGKVYLFCYTTGEDRSRNGLYFAWSTDKVNWNLIGPEYAFLQSDYGAWGSQKKLRSPFLFQDAQGLWHCIWSVNNQDSVFAHAASTDLVHWKRQSYPMMNINGNILQPQINKQGAGYHISWLSNADGATTYYGTTTTDFKTYTEPKVLKQPESLYAQIELNGWEYTGTMHQVDWGLVQGMINARIQADYKNQLNNETTDTDAERFAGLKDVTATIKVSPQYSKEISPLLMGVFFEDINYAADGGLYAELIQNRGFEYSLSDVQGNDKSWTALKAWEVTGAEFYIDSIHPLHQNNKHYLLLNATQKGAKVTNAGFDGIPVKAGEKYDLSFFCNTFGGKNKVKIALTDASGKVYGEATVKTSGNGWKKYSAVIKVKETITDAKLEIIPESGKLAIDMVSLFPQNTFKGHKNGLRADLAQTVADLRPRFVRFPGGCVSHGNGLDNIYKWKNTIGPLEARKPQRNIWNYHQSMGLGYFEYFQFCEDIGAEPLPVIAAGVPCQNSSIGGAGQQCGVPMEEMDAYVQDILDLIEWANGPATSQWGKKRVAAGHPQPFNLKYVGIGNEDLITDVFEERFTMIFNAIKEKHPEITVIGTVGPFYEGTDYDEGWEIANRLEVPMVDEHYYVPPGWMIYNQDFYDKYDRNHAKVYLGEYASHLPGRVSNMETALSEALYLTSVERNGDVVSMTSYAPLLAKDNHTQWRPDLIYFNNTEVKPTTDYYVQKLYGQNSGTVYYNSEIVVNSKDKKVVNRIGVSVVKDTTTNELIVKLVNMLPVEVNTDFGLFGFAHKKEGTITIFTGGPDDEQVLPVSGTFNMEDLSTYKMPPYSFTVIRVGLPPNLGQ